MDYEKAVLVDATVITMVALLIGLLVHAWLRRRNPELGYGLQGNVGTSAFGYADLVVVGALFLLIVARVVYDPGAGDGLDADADAAERLTPEMTWAGIFINMLLLGALFFFVGYMGRRSISEVFGLSRYPVWRVFAVAIGLMVVVVPLVFLAGFVFRRTVLNDVGDSLELQEAVRSLAEQSGFSMRFVLILAACVVAPVVEEFLFRGYFYPVIKRYS
ncbi:MAG: CPBP family glutamic-type intramembrane protease, partial [Verrucomicrobiota bacterium]